VFQAQKMRDAGKLDALVVSALQRTPLMKDLPTTEEAGYPNSAYNFWVGALVSAKTPRPRRSRSGKRRPRRRRRRCRSSMRAAGWCAS